MCAPRTAAMSSARRPSSVSRIARARSASPRCSDFDRSRNTACSAASAVSFDFPGMLGLHSPHLRQTIHSIAHSQTVCLDALTIDEGFYGAALHGVEKRHEIDLDLLIEADRTVPDDAFATNELTEVS